MIEFLKVYWILAVDAGVAGPEHKLPGLRVDQPPMLVVCLVGQCRGELLDVDGIQVQHSISVDLRQAAAGYRRIAP